MAVTFDPARGGMAYQRQAAQNDLVAPQTRGLLDFGSLVRERGLLDVQTSVAARNGTASVATRFDEGSLFGQATLARRDPVIRQGKAEIDVASTAGLPTELQGEAQLLSVEAARSEVPVSAEISPTKLVAKEAMASSRFAEGTFGYQPRSDAAFRISLATGRSASGGKASADAAADPPGFATRARFVEQLAFVHVIARSANSGLELTVRAAGVEGKQADLLERRLRDAADIDGAYVSRIRINCADRSDGARRSRDG